MDSRNRTRAKFHTLLMAVIVAGLPSAALLGAPAASWAMMVNGQKCASPAIRIAGTKTWKCRVCKAADAGPACATQEGVEGNCTLDDGVTQCPDKKTIPPTKTKSAPTRGLDTQSK